MHVIRYVYRFGSFVYMYTPNFYKASSYLSRYVKQRQDMWDIFQNAALKYYENNPGNIKERYFTVALKWALMDYLRDKYRRIYPFTPVIVYPNYEQEELVDLILDNAVPEIILFYEGYSLKELAQMKQCTVNAIKGRRFKGISRLQKAYSNSMYV